MKRNFVCYSTPTVFVHEVAIEKGYGDSVILPGFGSEEDELTY